MKKVILTGASGFIGRQAIPFLIKSNYEVHAVFCKWKTKFKGHPRLFWHKCDLLDFAAQRKLCARIKASYLLHFAWYTEPEKYWVSLENIRWVQASLDLLLNFVKNGGRRAVFAGTCAEYDWNYGYCSEKVTPLKPATLYGACKNSLENILRKFSSQLGLSYAWGRLFYLYGPYENPRRLVPSVIHTLRKKEIMRCSHGNQIRDFLYVGDAAEVFVKLLNSDICGPINIASGQPITVKEVVSIIAEKMGCRDLISFGTKPGLIEEAPLILADIARLTKEVRWKPKYDIFSGLDQLINQK
ncbi:MAG: NAD(P)-dependent oxidoreductase [Candidatus Omnitrophica bacterium]|nr:NAD(P)-dependent oxidoreductase [Candidatus Omnitrophota bacterium]